MTHLENATPTQLEHAAALNHQEWFRLNALAAGGEVRQAEGVTWTYAAPVHDGMIAFPRLAIEDAGAQLDEIVAYYRRMQPKGVGCWSLEPPQPHDLGARLLARGFQPGWRPCWMALDLQQMHSDYPIPAGLKIEEDNETDISAVHELPYVSPEDGAASVGVAQQALGRFQRFVARLDGRIVAQSAVLLTAGPHGIGGIYDVGVTPAARNQGIGKAVTLAACLYARKHGCRYAVLNATGRRMYEQIGFRWVGDGWTWWLKVDRLVAHPPTPEQVALVEALCTGNLERLAHLRNGLAVDDLVGPVTNGMTPLELAVHCGQPASVTWLMEQGVPLDVLAAWDLGWRTQAAQLLAERPEEANRQYGEWGATLLHLAAQRNDVELAQLALSAGPDLNQKDTGFQSTPLGWARHFQRAEIIRLITQHSGNGRQDI
jgi:ribosomal protein S18 acetylase RimI-like enzyme